MGMLNAVARCALVVGAGCVGAATADPFRDSDEPLPVEEAFVFTSWLQGGRLVVHWDMPEGYYLYRHRLEVRAGEGIALGEPAIPRGERKTDAYFGESEVHYGSVEVAVPVLESPAIVTARITYQGCADTGFCYPPQERAVAHEAPENPVSGMRTQASSAASELAESIPSPPAGEPTPAAVAAAEG